jgi:hypothetical protein
MQAALACMALLLAAAARAGEAGFTSGLSPGDQAAFGMSKLTGPQVAALDALVSRDVTLAHQGGVTGFSSAFCARHSERELADSGIDRLSREDRTALDMLAARAIAMGPPPTNSFAYAPPSRPVPAPAPVPSETVVSERSRMQVHGDITLTVGGGSHGRSFYGTSADVFVTDPTGRFTVGVGFEEFRGRGLIDLCGPYSIYGPVNGGYPYLGW